MQTTLDDRLDVLAVLALAILVGVARTRIVVLSVGVLMLPVVP